MSFEQSTIEDSSARLEKRFASDRVECENIWKKADQQAGMITRRFVITMTPNCQPRRSILLISLLCVAGSTVVPTMLAAQNPPWSEAIPWLDVSGEPLPFQSDEEIKEALLAASLNSRKDATSDGLEGYEMLVLEHQGAQFYALFLTDEDGASLELAASKIDQLLGLDNIPPVAERTIGDTPGVVQIWRGRAGNERELEQAGTLIPPNSTDFKLQHQTLMLLDKLIANPKRSPETVLVDPGWKIWAIGFAHAFRSTSELADPIELTKCDRRVWQRLKSLDKATLKQEMEPFLKKKKVNQLVTRHRKMVSHIQDMISTYGDEIVLFGPPLSE